MGGGRERLSELGPPALTSRTCMFLYCHSRDARVFGGPGHAWKCKYLSTLLKTAEYSSVPTLGLFLPGKL